MKNRVYIAHTGGTVGMKKTRRGYEPAAGYLAAQMTQIHALRHPSMPDFDLMDYSPLLDSSNMTPADWLKIANDIADRYDAYDGFVVLHGTDTMAYTASALAFMLEELGKPVILTGSQIPLCEVRNDARENLITAMLLASQYPIPEVCVYFGDKLMRGCRTVKVSADGFEAFASPNCAPLGTVGVDIEIDWATVRRRGQKARGMRVQPIGEAPIATLRLFPGLPAAIVRNILQAPLRGLILEAYGVGNGPTNDRRFMEALAEASARGVVIVDCTQCLRGTVDLDDYATGSALAQAGVISGFDMTVEAAVAKLSYLFSQSLSRQEVEARMQANLRGELTRITEPKLLHGSS